MEFSEYWNIVKRWWWLVFACVLVAAGASYVGTLGMPRIYQATTTVMVGQALQQSNPTGTDLYISQELAKAYAQMVRRRLILEGAAQALNLDFTPAAEDVSTRLVPGTNLLEISTRDIDPLRAQVLADEIAYQLILQTPAANEEADRQAFIHERLEGLEANFQRTEKEIVEAQAKLEAANSARAIQQYQSDISALEQKLSAYEATYASLLQSVQGSGTNYISIIEPASLPYTPISPNVLETVLVATVIGFGLAVGGIVLIEFLDDTIKSTDEVARLTQLPVLGAIARIEGDSSIDRLIVHQQPLSTVAEAYRVLRTNVRFSFMDRPMRTLMVTSAGPSEGKSVTISNLAVAMAQSGLRVILIDTDLRRPTLYKIFGVSNAEGLSDLLLSPELGVDSYLQETEVEGLHLLTCGSLPPNPAEVLGSERMSAAIESLQARADLLLFDSPPALVVTDAAILAARMEDGGVLLVTDINNTRRNMAKRAVEELQRGHANLLGVIVNRVSVRTGGGYYHYYQEYSDRDEGKQKRPPRRVGLSRIWPGPFDRHRDEAPAPLVTEGEGVRSSGEVT